MIDGWLAGGSGDGRLVAKWVGDSLMQGDSRFLSGKEGREKGGPSGFEKVRSIELKREASYQPALC